MIVYFTFHYRIISVTLSNMTSAAPLSVVLTLFSKGKEGAAEVVFERVTKITLPPYPQGYDSVFAYENICVGEFLDRHFV